MHSKKSFDHRSRQSALHLQVRGHSAASLSILWRLCKGLAEEFQAEERMLSPLDAFVLLQFLEDPLLPLSATICFEEGGVPLERETSDYYFHFLELPKSLSACRSIDSSFSLRGGHVTLPLMEKWHSFKPRCLRTIAWMFPTHDCCSPTDTRKVSRRQQSDESLRIQIQPVLRNSRGMNILQHDDSLTECQPLSVHWQGLAFQPVHSMKETFS